ncbi:hypothetical protein ACEZDB_08115 [Streptacidiphilus sp. N1-3]|uniref:AB hydrolase-1 domain-containing protein n=1 Tax=Streptacidiphilus alkalitolerans TaxID=3342712 RepID=A0ABV6WX61_9ACTN
MKEASIDTERMEIPPVEAGRIGGLADCLEESSHYLTYFELDSSENEYLDIPSDSPKLAGLYRSYEKGDTSAAVSLILACLRHPHPAVRTAAAACIQPLKEAGETRFHFPGPDVYRVESILKQGLWDEDPGIRELALTAWGAAALEPIAGASDSSKRRRQRGPLSLLVHGTNSYKGDWWRPHGAFFDYLASGPKPNLINDESPWSWSGECNERARQIAAKSVAGFQRDRRIRKFDSIIGHSYGGGIALMATQFGAKARKIVLLSTPAHDYGVNWDNVDDVVSLRIHWDNVLMLDCLYRVFGQRRRPSVRQYFSDSHIKEIPELPMWFTQHCSTHEPSVWVDNSVAEIIWPTMSNN